ncbi:hypothetical protein CHS0354_018401 [Potamilus streckersoni]|uniref:UvrD-like helicase C-terminal domain-containing protein n=1 Tax=Potamilus streckersoni TaxID=2493646 RepID=A0AAE0TAB6_9BIVA|nr:hypothetical protein CHS0354_018401 [Potamilus streckersoni]
MPAENMTALLTQRMGELLTGSAEIPAYIPKDIAVLVHTNRHAAKICTALCACGIPAMVDRSQALLSSAEAAAVLSMLKLLSPSGSADFYSHLAGNVLLPYTVSDIIRLRNSLSEAESIKQKLFRASAVLDKKGIIAAFRFLDEAFAISSRLACLEDGRQRLRNYTDALCFLNSLAARNRHTPQRLIDAFEAEISTPSEDLKTRQEKDGNTVKVLTVHAAKGLEFPCVFLLLQDSKKPSDSLNRKRAIRIEIEAEKIRLLYVGMTRASQHCEVIFSETLKQYREQLDPVIQTAGDPDNPVQVIYADPGKISADFIYRPAVPELIKPVVPDIFIAKPLIRRSFSALLAKSYLTEYTSADTVSHIKEAESGTENADIQKTDTDKNPEQENITPKPALAGTQLGSLVHEIFEVCSLSKPYDAQLPVISPIMDAYGAQPADREYVRATVNQVSACPLTATDNTTFTLSEVPDALWIREMLFMMRFHNLDLHACRARLTSLNNDYARHIAEIMNSKGFDVFDYLEGYIDAVIEYNGKLYILDWKTNNLGTAAANYSPQALRHTMHEAGYLLQQLIYTLGLRCYVASRMPGVPFDKVFGGVYYIFTRGLLTGEVSSVSGKQVNGIFYSTAAELLPIADILYTYTASEISAA